MATEPDDYQTISDNCPGYMVLISEGIICTRCAGEKRHKRNECPKPATAAHLATQHVLGADPDGMDNADWGMESLSDTSSVSSESTARSDGSEVRVTSAHQSDQGGNHSQDTRLPRRGFARPGASYASTQPDRTSASPSIYRGPRGPSQVPKHYGKADGYGSEKAKRKPQTPSRHDRDTMSASTLPAGIPLQVKQPPGKKRSEKTRQGSPLPKSSAQRTINYEGNQDRLPSRSLVDTTGKFDYSDTTCPSSFGFGRLPSEAMG